MTVRSYNLLDEPWVLARHSTGAVEEVSLREAFRRATELRGLAGEVPTQEVAVLRLLIAVLYRALPARGSHDERQEEWAEWWHQGGPPAERVIAYLEQHRERFDLLDSAAPFMQVAGLETGKTSGLRKLIADQPDGEQFFTTRAGRGAVDLSLAEATRWLVHAQAFDPSGIKSGALDDPRVKGGRGYPIGTGWAGNLGLVIVEGATLGETLLLSWHRNLESNEDDEPIWERPPLSGAPQVDHATPRGPADLFTWPSRRVLLLHNGGRVTDVRLCNGDPLHARNRQRQEPHTAWRHSKAQEAKLKREGLPVSGPVYMPRTHDPERSIWRGLPGLLVHGEESSGKNAVPPSQPPAVLDWLETLRFDEYLPPEASVTLRVTGVEYGSQNSTVAVIVDDALRLRAAVLTDDSLRGQAVRAVEDADHAVMVLANLARDLAAAAGRETDGPRARAREAGYLALDPGYRRWVSSLSPESDATERRTAWQSFVASQMRRLAYEMTATAGQTAWVGRDVRRPDGSTQHVDTGRASGWFHSALSRALTWLPTTPSSSDAQESA